MANEVQKYFKEAMKQIAFINLSDDFVDRHQPLRFLKGVPIPVNVEAMKMEAELRGGKPGFSPAIAAAAMVKVIGADVNFPYAEQYKRFLKYNVKSVYMIALGDGVQLAEQGRLLEAAIQFRFADIYNRWELKDAKPEGPVLRDPKLPASPDALFNYAKACREIYMSDEEDDAEKKVVFREESVEAFERLVEEFPDFDQSYYLLGFFYINKKSYEKAKKVWTTFMEKSDDASMKEEIKERLGQVESLMIYEKGYLEVVNDRPDEGLAILLPLYEEYKEWWNLLYFIGLAYRKKGEYDKALPFFTEVTRLKPSQSDSYNEMGLCYASIQNYEMAEKYFKKAALIEDNDPELLCNLAATYINWGKLEEAAEMLDKADALAPNEEITKLWRLELAKKYN